MLEHVASPQIPYPEPTTWFCVLNFSLEITEILVQEHNLVSIYKIIGNRTVRLSKNHSYKFYFQNYSDAIEFARDECLKHIEVLENSLQKKREKFGELERILKQFDNYET